MALKNNRKAADKTSGRKHKLDVDAEKTKKFPVPTKLGNKPATAWSPVASKSVASSQRISLSPVPSPNTSITSAARFSFGSGSVSSPPKRTFSPVGSKNSSNVSARSPVESESQTSLNSSHNSNIKSPISLPGNAVTLESSRNNRLRSQSNLKAVKKDRSADAKEILQIKTSKKVKSNKLFKLLNISINVFIII
jgi:hypothetical protein